MIPEESILPKSCPICGAHPGEYEEQDDSLERYECVTYQCELVLFVCDGKIENDSYCEVSIPRALKALNEELSPPPTAEDTP